MLHKGAEKMPTTIDGELLSLDNAGSMHYDLLPGVDGKEAKLASGEKFELGLDMVHDCEG